MGQPISGDMVEKATARQLTLDYLFGKQVTSYSMAIKKKNPAAVALGKLGGRARADNLTAEERSEIARKGAMARTAKLTPAERKRIAMLGVKARQTKRSKKRKGEA